MLYLPLLRKPRAPWNKGKLIGQKPPLKLREIWAIRIQLQLENRTKDVALFNLALDSKLRNKTNRFIILEDIFIESEIAAFEPRL